MPLLGLGTYMSKPGEVSDAVKFALDVGYRHLDCAEFYGNQKEIGQALTEYFAASNGKVTRKDIFITSKLYPYEASLEGIDKQFNQTLVDLQTDYIDLYLVHLPVSVYLDPNTKKTHIRRGISLQTIWRKFEDIYDSGRAKAIGVSNYTSVLINDLLNYCRIKPAVNQIERSPYLNSENHIKFCKSEGIEITIYGALGAAAHVAEENIKLGQLPPLLENPVVLEIAKKTGKTPAQVLIRWNVQDNIICIPKSVKRNRIEENWKIWDFELSHDDMQALQKLEAGFRHFKQDWIGFDCYHL